MRLRCILIKEGICERFYTFPDIKNQGGGGISPIYQRTVNCRTVKKNRKP